MILAGIQPHPAAHHLLVQGAHLRRAQNHDAVNGGAVPAFRQKHGIAEHVVFPGFKGGQHLGAVFAVAVHLGGAEPGTVQHSTKLLAGSDQRQEHHGAPALAVIHHLLRDLLQVRLQRRADLAHGEVAVADADAPDIQFQWNHLRPHGRKVAVADRRGHAVFVGFGIEIFPEVLEVAPVRRRRHTEDIGLREMLQYPLIAVAQGMVGFIYDDVLEIIPRKTRQALLLRQRLHGAHRNGEEAPEAG